MQLTLDNDVFYDEMELPVVIATENCSKEQKNEILAGSELLIKVRNFCEAVKTGTLKPKSATNEFETVLYKYDLLT